MMIIEQVLATLLLIINKGVDDLLLHICRRDDFVFAITLDIIATIVLKLRVLHFYRGLASLILSRYRLYGSVIRAWSHDCRVLEHRLGLLLLLLLLVYMLILQMMTVKGLVRRLHIWAGNAKDSIGGINSTLTRVIIVETIIYRHNVLLWHAAGSADQRSLLLPTRKLIAVEHLIIVSYQMRALIANEESTWLWYIGRSWGAGPTFSWNCLGLCIISSHSSLLLLRRGSVLGNEVIMGLPGRGLLWGSDYRWSWQGLGLLSTSRHHRVMLDEAPTWAFVQAGRPSFLWASCDTWDPLASKTSERLLLLKGWRMTSNLMRLLWSLEGQALILMRIRHTEVIRNIRLLHHVIIIFVQGALRWLVGRCWPLRNYRALLLLRLDHWLACWGTSCVHDCRLPAWLSCLIHWSVSRHESLLGHWGELIVRSLLDLTDGSAVEAITWVSGHAPVYQVFRILLHCALTWRITVCVGIKHLWVHYGWIYLPD